MNEFDLIKRYFGWGMGIGDDCAIVSSKHNITSIDTLIKGVHFPDNTSPADIAHKALAVNLSDIAAMGGEAKYFTLALSLPNIDEKWLDEFATSLKNSAQQYGVNLVGGDTTKGNLSITISIVGYAKKPLLRSGAKIGDGVFVSAELGGAALALSMLKSGKLPNDEALKKLNRPIPRLDLGLKLAPIANACIDISDGLLQDLSHILRASKVGADIEFDKIPIFANASTDQALYGGDDYELCWTGDINHISTLTNIHQIGTITQQTALCIDGKPTTIQAYQHF